MVSRRVLRFDAPALRELEWPCFEATGARDGPRLCVLAGVHGCEYPAIAAVVRFMRELDSSTLSGSVIAVPIVSPTSYRARSPFVTPEDGLNLNRCFPGDPAGSYSQVLAHHVWSELVSGSDLLIDLHGGDLVEALEPFTLYDDSPRRETARAMAVAYGLPYVVCDPGDRLGGTTSAAAAAAGIAAITAEVGGCGLLEPRAVDQHVRGLNNALRAVGMLPGDPDPPPRQHMVERFEWLRCAGPGWWQPEVAVGEVVAAKRRLGAVLDPFGDELEVVSAPAAGVALFVTSSPAVGAGGLLLGLGCDLSEIAR